MIPITGQASMYFLINNKLILIHSMLAAGIVQDMFVGEAGEGKGGKEETLEATFTLTCTGTFTAQA